MTEVRQKLSQIDQVNLEEHIKQWMAEDPSRKFYMRPCTVTEEELLKEKKKKPNDGDDEEDEDEINVEELLIKVSSRDVIAKQKKFLYVHQEQWQRVLLVKYGNNVSLMDATYKTTKYNLPLFFIVVLTNSGYEIVGKQKSSGSKFC